MPNENLLKIGYMSITDNPSDDYRSENYGTVGIWLATSVGSRRQKCKVLKKLIHLTLFVELSSLIILVKTNFNFTNR
jgi:hypothetical protein